MGMPIPQEYQQFAGTEAVARVLSLGPPGEAPLREALRTEPEALAIVTHELERRASAIAEDKDRPAEGIVCSHLTAHGRESIDAFAEIDGLRGEQDATLGGELEHQGVSKKVRTKAVRGIWGS